KPDEVALLHAAHQFLAPPRTWLAEGIDAPGHLVPDVRLVTTALKRSQDGRVRLPDLAWLPAGPVARARADEMPRPDLALDTVGARQIVTWRVQASS